MLRLFKLTLVLMALAFMATSPAQARAFFWYADGKGNIITEPVEKDPPVETAASTPTAVDTPSTPHSGQASGNTADAPHHGCPPAACWHWPAWCWATGRCWPGSSRNGI